MEKNSIELVDFNYGRFKFNIIWTLADSFIISDTDDCVHKPLFMIGNSFFNFDNNHFIKSRSIVIYKLGISLMSVEKGQFEI